MAVPKDTEESLVIIGCNKPFNIIVYGRTWIHGRSPGYHWLDWTIRPSWPHGLLQSDWYPSRPRAWTVGGYAAVVALSDPSVCCLLVPAPSDVCWIPGKMGLYKSIKSQGGAWCVWSVLSWNVNSTRVYSIQYIQYSNNIVYLIHYTVTTSYKPFN